MGVGMALRTDVHLRTAAHDDRMDRGVQANGRNVLGTLTQCSVKQLTLLLVQEGY